MLIAVIQDQRLQASLLYQPLRSLYSIFADSYGNSVFKSLEKLHSLISHHTKITIIIYHIVALGLPSIPTRKHTCLVIIQKKSHEIHHHGRFPRAAHRQISHSYDRRLKLSRLKKSLVIKPISTSGYQVVD